MCKVIEISAVADLNRQTFKKNEFPENIKYLDTGNLTKNKIDSFQYLNKHADKIPSRAQRKVCLNTILYSTVRPNQEHYGIVESIIDNIVVSTGFTTIDVTDNFIHPKFLYYLLTQSHITDYLHTIGINSVSSYPSISPDDIGGLKFKVPKTSIQKSLAKVLSDLDKKIELNNKINAELEAMAKLIYDYWFVQFDFPDANGKPYKSSGGKMVYDDVLKREIPDGWEVDELSHCIETILDHRGKTPKKLGADWTESENGILALSAKSVKGGKLINLDKAKKIDRELFDKWMPDKLKDGDVLMTSEAPAGEFYFIHGKTDYCMSQRLFAIRAKQTVIVASYLYYELSKGHGYSQILGGLSGSTVFGIRQDVLRTINVVVPKLHLQQKFNEIVLPQLKEIKNLGKENLELEKLRDWLLPMLMNGQVTC